MVDERTNSEVDENTITLVFDDGIEEECEIMGVFEVEDNEYVAVAILKNAPLRCIFCVQSF